MWLYQALKKKKGGCGGGGGGWVGGGGALAYIDRVPNLERR